MKRIIALILTLMLAMVAIPAMAEQTEYTIMAGQSACLPDTRTTKC